MKVHIRIFACLLAILFLGQIADARRVNFTTSAGGFFTITAGTPIRVYGQRQLVNRLFIQSIHGNTGLVYVMLGVPVGTACNATNAAHLTAELGPGTATSPGGAFSDPQGANGDSPPDAEDISQICLDGSHTGDVVLVSAWARN